MNRKTKNFQRLLKLPAALGDWTKLNLEDTWLEEMQVAEINYPCFDGLAKDQLKKAHLLHYRLAEKIARKLSDDINMKVELYSVGIQQTSYEEFVKTMQGKAAVKIDFAVNNNKTTTFVGQALASVLLDRLLGGKGKVSENHSFSEIDLEILSAEFQGMLPLYYELWGSQLSEKEDKLKLIFETYKEDKKIGKRDSYIFFSMDFLLDNDQPQKIILGYHNQILKVLLQKEEVSEQTKGDKREVLLNQKTEKNIKVPVSVRLGKSHITMKDLKNLQVDDIITFDNKVNESLDVFVGESVRLKGQPVSFHKRCAVQLLLDNVEANKAEIKETFLQAPLEEDTLEESIEPTLPELEEPLEKEAILDKELSQDVEDQMELEDIEADADQDAEDLEEEAELDQEEDDLEEEEAQEEKIEDINKPESTENKKEKTNLNEDDFSWDDIE